MFRLINKIVFNEKTMQNLLLIHYVEFFLFSIYIIIPLLGIRIIKFYDFYMSVKSNSKIL